MNTNFYPLKELNIHGPLFISKRFRDTKDPCPVFDGKQWHLYGSGGSSIGEGWCILHAVAQNPRGPWQELPPCELIGLKGPHVAAPSVVFDFQEQQFHMFIQKEFMGPGGTIEHLSSRDGLTFSCLESILASIPDSAEAGVYDPHAAEIKGKKYISYSAMPETKAESSGHWIIRPDIFLAKSTTNDWNGPWERVGVALTHEQVPFHNPKSHPDYEWGLEGSQLIELPNGIVILNAVCFLPEGVRGTRQRVFLAAAREAAGPYSPIGPILDPASDNWHSGENGHAAGVVLDNTLMLFYQGRTKPGSPDESIWRYGTAEIKLEELYAVCEKVLV